MEPRTAPTDHHEHGLFHNRTEGQPVSNQVGQRQQSDSLHRRVKRALPPSTTSGSGGLVDQSAGRRVPQPPGGNDYCSGGYVTVDGSGKASLNVPGMKASPSCRLHHTGPRGGSCPAGQQVQQHEPCAAPTTPGATPPTTVDANRVWSATSPLTGNGDATGAQRFQVRCLGNWAENYGDNEGMAR